MLLSDLKNVACLRTVSKPSTFNRQNTRAAYVPNRHEPLNLQLEHVARVLDERLHLVVVHAEHGDPVHLQQQHQSLAA
jgi:hypothetical protein